MGPNKIPTKPDRTKQNPPDSDRAGTTGGEHESRGRQQRAAATGSKKGARARAAADNDRQQLAKKRPTATDGDTQQF